MYHISITEFRKNVNHYIELCKTESICITKYGKEVAVLSSSDTHYYQTLLKLYGCLRKGDAGQNYKDIIGEEIMKRCGY